MEAVWEIIGILILIKEGEWMKTLGDLSDN